MTSFMTGDGTIAEEPVALGATIQGLILALFVVNREFDWVAFTDGQESSLVVLYLALLAVVTWFQRRNVTPNVKLP